MTLQKALKAYVKNHNQAVNQMSKASGSEEPKLAEEIVCAVWSDIDNAFSKPTKASDVNSVYAPTQIISEFIKLKGYDGTAHKSALAKRT